jgi:hypothetical protein
MSRTDSVANHLTSKKRAGRRYLAIEPSRGTERGRMKSVRQYRGVYAQVSAPMTYRLSARALRPVPRILSGRLFPLRGAATLT